MLESSLWSPESIAVISAVLLLAGFVKGVVGLGLPTVSLGLLTAFFDLKAAIALMLVPSFATNVVQGLLSLRDHKLCRFARVGLGRGVVCTPMKMSDRCLGCSPSSPKRSLSARMRRFTLRFSAALLARGSAAICALQKPASVRRSGGIWRVACSLVTRATTL